MQPSDSKEHDSLSKLPISIDNWFTNNSTKLDIVMRAVIIAMAIAMMITPTFGLGIAILALISLDMSKTTGGYMNSIARMFTNTSAPDTGNTPPTSIRRRIIEVSIYMLGVYSLIAAVPEISQDILANGVTATDIDIIAISVAVVICALTMVFYLGEGPSDENDLDLPIYDEQKPFAKEVDSLQITKDDTVTSTNMSTKAEAEQQIEVDEPENCSDDCEKGEEEGESGLRLSE